MGYPQPSTATGAPSTADYLVGSAQAGLSAEIVAGTAPAGELGGTWALPTVDATHSGSSHAGVQAAAEATAAAALATHAALTTTAHGGFRIGQATIASGSAIAAPTGGGVVLLTGTTAVDTMTGGATGDVVTLVASGQASGVPVVLNHATGANNLALAGGRNLGIYAQVPADTAASVGESVTFVKTATYWQEIDRSLRLVLDYVQITADVNITGTTEATATAAITASAITFDGATPIRINIWAAKMTRGTSWITPVLYDGTSIGLFAAAGDIPLVGAYETNKPFVRRLTPTNAAHTFSFRCYVDAGTGVVAAGTGGVGARMPSHMTISRDI